MPSRFGALAEVLTDQGREFQGDFQALCELAYIDHRTTSRDHPEADGLAERMVQTVKRGLRKYGVQHGHYRNWDAQLPWLAMGYRFSKQASLSTFSPYFLLYGREPVLPATIQRDIQGFRLEYWNWKAGWTDLEGSCSELCTMPLTEH